jgi:phosphoheptose isomerase
MNAEFSASPESLVRAAERTAEGLGNGGRLLVDGRGRAVPDAHHVVVEFMHPVTVGKRALPAVAGLAGRGPSDVTMSIAYGGTQPAPDVDVTLCDLAPCDVDPATAEKTQWVTLPPEDVGAAKVAAVLSYHVLWELTHLFLEADATSTSDDEQLRSLYPMLYPSADNSARDATLASAIDSAREKIAESSRVCARTLRDNADAIEQIAAMVAAAPSVFTFGNGGSSTDAADAAVAFVERQPDRLARNYMTSRWAAERSSDPSLVQHHHAHVCALMAEHSIRSTDPVIGVAFDGTGYGTDGAIWGGEVLVADYAGFERVAALADIALPGGDAAIRKPQRVALSHLRSAGIEWRESLPPVAVCPLSERAALASMFESGTGCVPTSSMGRLFDAVSSLLGVRHEISFEGQAAMELEHLATAAVPPHERRVLRFVLDEDSLDGTSRIGVAPVLAGLVDGLAAGESVPSLAAAFHDATAAMIVMVAERVRDRTGIQIVGLTGGVFQNALLVESARCGLETAGFRVLLHRMVPPNDGGLALGQAVASAASARREPLGHGGGDEDDAGL